MRFEPLELPAKLFQNLKTEGWQFEGYEASCHPWRSRTPKNENFENAKINKNLKECPSHWGGFSFVPYYFEFWEGNENRVNKRTVYKKDENIWKKYYLQP